MVVMAFFFLIHPGLLCVYVCVVVAYYGWCCCRVLSRCCVVAVARLLGFLCVICESLIFAGDVRVHCVGVYVCVCGGGFNSDDRWCGTVS
eukprot:EC714441.1.p3 GENE.EC714441.1~~EC714441.1.p3  ORF type:complete len:90 (+),score=14.35 EC714441.1:207-476(+)